MMGTRPLYTIDIDLWRAYCEPMNLKKVLSPKVVTVNISSDTKEGVIDELLAMLDATGKITNLERAKHSVMERERKMSTGMEHGIAIPHGKTDAVDELIACIGVSKHPVDFKALDNEPSRIFIMTLSPVNRTGPHIQFLAEVSQLLTRPERRDLILAAQTDEDLYKAFIA